MSTITRENYSYSKLDTYQQCPFKFKIRYLDKQSFFSNTVATEIGTLVHATEEAIAKSIQAGSPIDYVELKNTFVLELYQLEAKYAQTFNSPDKSGRTYKEKAFDYLNTGIYELENFIKAHPTYKIVGIEQPFEVNYNEKVRFKGFIDRVFADTETNSLIIQDIKTWAIKAEDSKLETPLQFVIYTLAAEQLWPQYLNEIKCQYYLPFCHLTQDAGSVGYVQRGLNSIEKTFANIDANKFAPKPTPLCYYCEYCVNNPSAPDEAKLLCPYHSEWTPQVKSFAKANNWEGLEQHEMIQQLYEAQIRPFMKKS